MPLGQMRVGDELGQHARGIEVEAVEPDVAFGLDPQVHVVADAIGRIVAAIAGQAEGEGTDAVVVAQIAEIALRPQAQRPSRGAQHPVAPAQGPAAGAAQAQPDLDSLAEIPVPPLQGIAAARRRRIRLRMRAQYQPALRKSRPSMFTKRESMPKAVFLGLIPN